MADTESDPEIIGLTRSPIRVERLVANVTDPKAGATAVFLGTVRKTPRPGTGPEGRVVTRMDYQAYENMALLHLRKLADEIRDRWDVSRVAIVHRLGTLEVGDPSVAIVISSPHRPEAFEACRYVIERLKEDAPIWKKEHYRTGDPSWVANVPTRTA